jgi:hypothetical protein
MSDLPRVELHDPLGISRLVTLYKTPSPGLSLKSGEYYELALGQPPSDTFVLKEYHGYWDELERRPAPGHTVALIGHYRSLEEGNAAFEKQKLFRAKQGFMHGLRPGYHPSEPIYEFVEIKESDG